MNPKLIAIERGISSLVHLHVRIGPMIDNELRENMKLSGHINTYALPILDKF